MHKMQNSEDFQKPRGTQDIFFSSYDKFETIVNCTSTVGKLHNFNTIRTPTFENTSLFERNIGETSDAVSKELYRFEDMGGRNLALRPEFTAGVVRAFLENYELNSHTAPLRLFSWGQIFRYDRPKKGRYREFHQINFECFNESSDIIAFAVAVEIFQKLGVTHKVKLLLNYLGDAKVPYTIAVKEYFTKHFAQLSETSKVRLEKNPLRILDSKEKQDIALLAGVPKISDFHSNDDKSRLEKIVQFLSGVENLQFEIDENLVRGLDYYTGVIFEFVSPISENGENLAVLGGGRYDALISQMGGKQTNAIGFGGGIERLMLLLESTPVSKQVFIITTHEVNENESFDAFKLINRLKNDHTEASFQEICVEKNKIGKTLQRLSSIPNSFAIVIGERELQKHKATMKDLVKNQEVGTVVL
jgi:histidyl-tRNA synthetase